MASSCFGIFHVINIPFNCSGTAKRVAKGMIEDYNFVLRHSRTSRQDLRPFLISETGLKGISQLNSRRKGPGNRASPINSAHARKSFVAYHLHINYPVKNHVH